MTHTILFFSIAAVAVTFAVLTVTARRILRSVLYLMVVLTATAAFYVMLKSEFLAGIQLLVYVGGIVVLFAFATMLTRTRELSEAPASAIRKLTALAASAAFFIVSVQAIKSTDLTVLAVLKEGELTAPDTVEIGRRLLDYGPRGYVIPFEVISLLLLAALIGAIVIARKNEEPGA